MPEEKPHEVTYRASVKPAKELEQEPKQNEEKE